MHTNIIVMQATLTVYLMKYKTYVLASSLQYSELPGAAESDIQEYDNTVGYHSNSEPSLSWSSTIISENGKETLLI